MIYICLSDYKLYLYFFIICLLYVFIIFILYVYLFIACIAIFFYIIYRTSIFIQVEGPKVVEPIGSIPSPKLTYPPKIGRAPKESSLQTTIFQGLC